MLPVTFEQSIKTIAPRLFADNITHFYDLGDDAKWIKRIEDVYLYDENRQTYCASLSPSYECTYLYTCLEFVDGIDESLRESLYDKYSNLVDLDVCYFTARSVKPTVVLEDEDCAEEDYDETFAELIEHYMCNWHYG